MSQSSQRPLILIFLILTWILVLGALFIVTAGASVLFFLCALVPTLLFAVLAVLSAQNFSNSSPKGAPYFYGSLISLFLVVLILVSPFLSPLSPIRSASTAVINRLSLLILGKTPYEWGHPVKTAEEWIQQAWALPTGNTLNFNTFPGAGKWTRVCIFIGHTTDAQFSSLIKLDLKWKLSDKSKSTTHKNFAAIVFINDAAKTVTYVQDIPQSSIEFDTPREGKCLKPSQAVLLRRKNPSELIGPVFSP